MSKANEVKTETPQRPLRPDFTSKVLRNSIVAKRRADRKWRVFTYIKEIRFMKAVKFMHTVPGAAAALAVVAAGSIGVYALTNWFGGNVIVSQKDPSIFSVDVSSCKVGDLVGFNPGDDPHNLQFKVVGNPHVSARDLRNDLLGICENKAVHKFYAAKYPEANFDGARAITGPTDPLFHYLLIPATLEQSSPTSITVRYNLSAKDNAATALQKTFPVAANATFYQAGQPVALNSLKPGDNIMLVAYSAKYPASIEGTSILDSPDVVVRSIFKTQYNDNVATDFNYQRQNVEPLDIYNAPKYK